MLKELIAVTPKGIEIPTPLIKLYDWIESNGFYIDTDNGRLGFLYSEEKMKKTRTDISREGGTIIDFAASGNVNLKYWFGFENSELLDRLCVFGQTGGDGSECALWIAEDGRTKIVHLGSGSGSTLCCVLSDNAVDFLRLIAIGYDEICWGEDYSKTPNEARDDFTIKPNKDFQNWVVDTFKVTIPERANEIVKKPSFMGDENPEDEFAIWVNQMTEKYG